MYVQMAVECSLRGSKCECECNDRMHSYTHTTYIHTACMHMQGVNGDGWPQPKRQLQRVHRALAGRPRPVPCRLLLPRFSSLTVPSSLWTTTPAHSFSGSLSLHQFRFPAPRYCSRPHSDPPVEAYSSHSARRCVATVVRSSTNGGREIGRAVVAVVVAVATVWSNLAKSV